MTSAVELERLMKRAQADAHADPPFFTALLDAMVYAHVPAAAPPAHKGFLAFRHPQNGVMMVTFFTDERRAQRATEGVARVVALNGRAFMEATRGSTLALNPQDTPTCVLYPEEVGALLDQGYMAECQTLGLDDETRVSRLDKPPDGLLEIVVGVLRELPYVETAYLAARASDDESEPASILLAVGCESRFTERAARALGSVLQRRCERFGVLLDMLGIDPTEPPSWIVALKLEPVYRRSSADRSERARSQYGPS
jgi:hypothetical protein